MKESAFRSSTVFMFECNLLVRVLGSRNSPTSIFGINGGLVSRSEKLPQFALLAILESISRRIYSQNMWCHGLTL
jgi:hypothetical protein